MEGSQTADKAKSLRMPLERVPIDDFYRLSEKQLGDLEWALEFMRKYEHKHNR